jgi:microcystin-dependent protein
VSDPYLGEIRMIAFGYPPRGWALCDGAILPINTNQAVFALLGTSYGGDGVSTFALPDLRGRVPVHTDNGVPLGSAGGEESHVLTRNEMPQHTHQLSASTAAADVVSPAGAAWGVTKKPAYGAGSDTGMAPAALGAAGQSQPHDNMPPFLTVHFAIALAGIFPSRN